MRSKMFVVFMMVAAAFAVGCGGGGGGSDGGGTTTTYTVAGTATAPDGDTGWAASIRPAISLTNATAQAFKTDGTSVSSEQTLSAGAFSLAVTPASGVYVKIKNSKGLDLRTYIGTISANISSVAVNASTTVEALLNEYGVSATDTYALTTLTNSIVALYAAAPTVTSGQTLYDLFKSTNATTLSNLSTAITEIETSNTAVETALKAENLTDAVVYFSPNFIGLETDTTTNLDNFKSVTQDRFDRYTITSYSFTIVNIDFTDADTAVVKVNGSISATNATSGSTVGPVTLTGWDITWKKENGKWLVYRNFPYLQSQIF